MQCLALGVSWLWEERGKSERERDEIGCQGGDGLSAQSRGRRLEEDYRFWEIVGRCRCNRFGVRFELYEEVRFGGEGGQIFTIGLII